MSKALSTLILLAVFCLGACVKKTDMPAPVVSFSDSAVAHNFHAPTTINFNNTGIYAWKFNWQFGDGDSSTIQSPSHQYTKAGSFTVKLLANGFKLDSTEQTLTILPAYTSIQVSSIQVQDLGDYSGNVSTYFRITNGGSHVYWTSGTTILNDDQMPETFNFSNTPFLSVNQSFTIEFWNNTNSNLEGPQLISSTPITPSQYMQGTNLQDSYPTFIQGEGFACGITWK